MVHFSGVKVFSATKADERARIGDDITSWIRRNPDLVIVDCVVEQSSDEEFHCVSVTLFYADRRVDDVAESATSIFSGAKSFCATKAREREDIGDVMTAWIRGSPELEIISREVKQSSDHAFHCLTFLFFYNERAKKAAVRAA